MRRSVLPALSLALVLSACGFSDAADGDADASSTAAPSTSSEAAPGTEVELNERGNIAVEFGEEAAIRASSDPEAPPMLTLTIEELLVDPPCDDESEVPPENGHYLAFRMRAVASDDFDPRVASPIADYDFSVLGSDGTSFDPVSPAGRACFGPPRLIQNMRVGPGYEYEGWMVLDAPVESGALVYAPGGEGPNQWEWQF
ncbi:hypothetical protein [Blastococcus aurantiacus]|nr:hypothetical protein [Blastococcus aurantiacus]